MFDEANAIIGMARALRRLVSENIDIRIADIKGGSAHNAIPREMTKSQNLLLNAFEAGGEGTGLASALESGGMISPGRR